MESLTEIKYTDLTSLSTSEFTDDEDKVFLIYNEEQTFEHSRKRLSKISLFFRNLFAGEYSDSKKREISIIHSEDVNTFQEFLNCANCEQPFDVVGFFVNDALKKYEVNNFEELLKLLNLASYLAADDLVNCILYILVSYWFDPMHLIQIWLMSKQMAYCDYYCDLQNAAFAMILDIFEHIPKNLLLSLSMPHIEQIITNPNIRCSETYFEKFVNEWARENNKSELMRNAIISEFKKHRSYKKDRYLQCITSFTTIPETGEKTLVFTWNGTEVNELSDISDVIKPFSLVGSQILGRGFSIYVVGGERSIGRNNFNKDVVRYCRLTKKCYRVARLTIPRRHMVAAFLGNKLILVGGVGMYRIKLNSVHILDIHTGAWTNGPNVPEEFAENPPACVCGDQLLVAKSDIYSYKIESNRWEIFWRNKSVVINNITCYNKEVYVTVKKPTEENVVQIFILKEDESDTVQIPHILYVSSVTVGTTYNLLSIDNRLIWFSMLNPAKLKIEVGEFKSRTTYEKLLENSVEINNNIRLKPYVGCFNILSLQALHPKMVKSALERG